MCTAGFLEEEDGPREGLLCSASPQSLPYTSTSSVICSVQCKMKTWALAANDQEPSPGPSLRSGKCTPWWSVPLLTTLGAERTEK